MSEISFTGLKSRCVQVCILSGGPRGESMTFLASGDIPHSLTPSFIFKASGHLPVSLSRRSPPSLLLSHCAPVSPWWLHLVYLINPG